MRSRTADRATLPGRERCLIFCNVVQMRPVLGERIMSASSAMVLRNGGAVLDLDGSRY